MGEKQRFCLYGKGSPGIYFSEGDQSSMFRTLMTLALMLGLFLCPLRCLGVLSFAAPSVAAEAPACCSHCAHQQSDHSAPASPSIPQPDDCDCDQCFCKGCVVEMARKPTADLTSLSTAALPSMSFCSVLSHHPSDFFRSPFWFIERSLSSGRMLRITRQSLLI